MKDEQKGGFQEEKYTQRCFRERQTDRLKEQTEDDHRGLKSGVKRTFAVEREDGNLLQVNSKELRQCVIHQ